MSSVQEALFPPPFTILHHYSVPMRKRGDKRGSSGYVVDAKDDRGLSLKIKVMEKSWNELLLHYIPEMAALRYLSHPNIIKPRHFIFYDSLSTPLSGATQESLRKTRIGLAFAAGRYDLFTWIARKLVYRADLHQYIPCLLFQLVAGLSYMHERGITHRDLKPQNLILFSDQDDLPLLQIADFGGCQFDLRREEKQVTIVTSREYRSPEMIVGILEKKDHVPYDERCDLWSVGIIFFILLACDYPVLVKDDCDLPAAIGELYCLKERKFSPAILEKLYSRKTRANEVSTSEERVKRTRADSEERAKRTRADSEERAKRTRADSEERKFYPWVTENALDLLYRLLTIEPEDRITAREALNHPYFVDPHVKRVRQQFCIPEEIYERAKRDEPGERAEQTKRDDEIGRRCTRKREMVTYPQKFLHRYIDLLGCFPSRVSYLAVHILSKLNPTDMKEGESERSEHERSESGQREEKGKKNEKELEALFASLILADLLLSPTINFEGIVNEIAREYKVTFDLHRTCEILFRACYKLEFEILFPLPHTVFRHPLYLLDHIPQEEIDDLFLMLLFSPKLSEAGVYKKAAFLHWVNNDRITDEELARIGLCPDEVRIFIDDYHKEIPSYFLCGEEIPTEHLLPPLHKVGAKD